MNKDLKCYIDESKRIMYLNLMNQHKEEFVKNKLVNIMVIFQQIKNHNNEGLKIFNEVFYPTSRWYTLINTMVEIGVLKKDDGTYSFTDKGKQLYAALNNVLYGDDVNE